MYVDHLNVQRKHKFDLGHVTTGVMAGSTCPEDLCKSVIQELNMKDFVVNENVILMHKSGGLYDIYQQVAYGLTETSPVTFLQFTNDSIAVKSTTIGYPLDHTEAKVVDLDGRVVPVGTHGELCTRGYSTMLGYWGDEQKTREAITPDRWFHTG